LSQQWDAVVAGHICLDLIPDLSRIEGESLSALLRPGQLVEVGAASISTGGAVSNTGLALHKLGIRTRLMGKIGDDMLGRVVEQVVEAHGPGLSDGMVVDPASDTSYTVIINPPGIDRMFLHAPAANSSFGAADVRYDEAAQARLFHFGYPPLMRRTFVNDGAELVEVFRRVHALGVTTSLDMALPDPASEAGSADWARILANVMPFVDVFLPSVEELLFMARRPEYDALLRQAGAGSLLPLVTADLLTDLSDELLAKGGHVVGIKLGDRGLYLRTAEEAKLMEMGTAAPADLRDWADRELWIPCFEARLVGTTGAGDATIAGFLAGLLRRLSVKEAARMAVAVGACNVEAADALSGLRSWDETVARVAGGWAQHRLSLDALGWHLDPENGIWECSR
jgi:sugar/nucleoside kinase (ribokinase family)